MAAWVIRLAPRPAVPKRSTEPFTTWLASSCSFHWPFPALSWRGVSRAIPTGRAGRLPLCLLASLSSCCFSSSLLSRPVARTAFCQTRRLVCCNALPFSSAGGGWHCWPCACSKEAKILLEELLQREENTMGKVRFSLSASLDG